MFVWQLIKSVSNDISIDCITPLDCENDDFRQQVNERGGNLYTLNLKKSINLDYSYYPIKSFLSEHDYDIIHIHASTIQELSSLAAATRNNKVAKVIVHSHGTGTKFNFAIRIIRRIAALSMEKHVDCYCACSKAAAKWKFTPKHQKMTNIIYNGIETEKYKFDPERRKDVRNRLNISDYELVLGNVGRLCDSKNQSYLIKIFESFLLIKPNAKLILVGDGPNKHELEKLVEFKKLSNQVIFVGNTNDVAGYLMAMDIFVFPSIHEALGFAVVEAQASGLPVIAACSLPDTVKMSDIFTFLPIGNNNISKWIDAILNCRHYDDRKKGSEIIRRAGYDIKNTVKQIEQLYFSLTEKERH